MINALSLKERFQLSRFIKGEKADTIPVTLSHRRIFILPVKKGIGFVALITILILIAFIYNNNLAYFLAFLLASIFFVSILHSYKSISGIIVRPGKCEPVFTGEAAEFTFYLENPENQHKINLHIKPGVNAGQQFGIPPDSTTKVTLLVKTFTRGWQTLDTVTIFSYFPLGLFRAWSPMRFDMQVLVYPKPTSLEKAFPNMHLATDEKGNNITGDDDFYGLQEYQAGDAIRNIHWKTYAKGQGLFSKQYSGSLSSEIWLDYTLTPGNDKEERISQLCRWVLDAEHVGISYGFKLAGLELAPTNGREHLNECLKALALF